MKNAEYIVELIKKKPRTASIDKLNELLKCKNLLEKPANPQRFTASFALEQARRRSENIRLHGKETFGIEELIPALSKISKDEFLDSYIFENDQYLGTCYVSEAQFVGCEFVRRGGTKSVPGLWIED